MGEERRLLRYADIDGLRVAVGELRRMAAEEFAAAQRTPDLNLGRAGGSVRGRLYGRGSLLMEAAERLERMATPAEEREITGWPFRDRPRVDTPRVVALLNRLRGYWARESEDHDRAMGAMMDPGLNEMEWKVMIDALRWLTEEMTNG